jgi:MoaA/NifB/PqqE/SkfB family radical SAM enzyme
VIKPREQEQADSAFALMEAPYHVNWNITYRCPMNCWHCYSRPKITTEELDATGRMNVARKLAGSKVFSVNLGGGEPLVLDDIFAVIETLSAGGVSVSLGSSGWGGLRGQARDLKDSGLGSVILSLDSPDAATHDALRRRAGSYSDVLTAASHCVAAGLSFSISTVLTHKNADSLEALLDLAREIGASGVELKRLRLVGNATELSGMLLSAEQEQRLFDKIPDWKRRYPFRVGLTYGEEAIEGIDQGCPCGRSSLCVLANGDVAPCVYNARAIGNILKDDLSRLWLDSPSLRRLRAGFHCQGSDDQESEVCT